MAILAGFTLIRAVCAVHLALGYVLLTAPQLLSRQGSIYVLGAALGLSQPSDAFHLNPLASSFLGLLFVFVAVCDLAAVGAAEETARAYWGAQVPIRLSFFFTVVGYCYLFKPARDVARTTEDPIKNSLVFTWGFLEVALWFWAYTSLREEAAEVANRLAHQHRLRAEQAMLRDE